jgi:Flp pilus assembly protein TadD
MTATACGACGVAFREASSTEKVDALLDDLLGLSPTPPEEGPPEAGPEEMSDVDEEVAEELFDSLLVEIQPSPAEPRDSADLQAPLGGEASSVGLADVGRIPVIATPGDAESGKLLRVSGRMFDLVTFGSVGALVAVFVGFKMYETPFDPANVVPTILFAGIAASGMVAALILYHVSNSEIAQGDRLVKQGRHEEAILHYDRAIRMVRRPSYAWTSRGVAMKFLGRLDEALRCHENAIRLDPTNEVAWCNLGTVYFKKGELGKAIECYDKAIHLRPKYAIAWNNKGVVLARMNQFQEADRCHAKATTIRPEYVAAWLNRGEVLARLGAREEAQRCLEKARAISRGTSA